MFETFNRSGNGPVNHRICEFGRKKGCDPAASVVQSGAGRDDVTAVTAHVESLHQHGFLRLANDVVSANGAVAKVVFAAKDALASVRAHPEEKAETAPPA